MKTIFYFILLLTLGIRLYDEIEVEPPSIGDKIVLQGEVYHAKFYAKKSYRSFYSNIAGLEDGNYEGSFKILEKRGSFYEFEVYHMEKKKKRFLSMYMENTVKEFSRGRDPSLQHFLEAILLGKSWALFREEKKMFQYVGLSHLLAMSGLHVSLLFLLLDKVLVFFRIQKQKRTMMLLFVLSLYFMGIFLSPSFFRAYLMAIFYLIGNLIREKVSKTKVLFLSLWVLLMINPNFLTSLSFLLSYLTIFSIFYLIPFVHSFLKEKSFLFYLSYPMVIQLMSTPLLCSVFGVLPCFSFLVNLFILPLGSALILLSFFTFLLEIFHLGFFLLPILEISYEIFYSLIETISKLPYLTIFLEKKLSYEVSSFFYIFFFSIFYIHVMMKKKEKEKDRENNSKRM